MNARALAGRQDMVREAAARLARVRAAGLRPEDDLTLSAWRRENPLHESAFRYALQAWDGARALRDAPGYADLLGAPTWRERWVAARRRGFGAGGAFTRHRGWAAAGAAALAVAIAIGHFVPQRPDYRTQVAQTREVRLDDGSMVSLGARSALDVEFTATERRVRLVGGEAFFSVTKDAGRPFVVAAGDALIRVVGTRFNVNLDQARARVAVEEGVVEVLRAGDAAGSATPADGVARSHAVAAPLRLTAGEQVVVRGDLPLPPVAEPLRGAEPGAWRHGRLSYRDATLAEVVADANRYRAAPIRIAAPELEGRRITTSFRAGQVEQMLDTLPDTLPVAVLRRADGSVDLERSSVRR